MSYNPASTQGEREDQALMLDTYIMSAPATLALVHRLTVYGPCSEDHGGCVVNKLVTGRDVSGQVDTCRNQSTKLM
jgi:hypothetical protein